MGSVVTLSQSVTYPEPPQVEHVIVDHILPVPLQLGQDTDIFPVPLPFGNFTSSPIVRTSFIKYDLSPHERN